MSTTPEPTNPAAAVEVRDRCPHCGDHQLVPRVQMGEHLARLHPEQPTISPVRCPVCPWAVHGIPDAYTAARAEALAGHQAEEHAPEQPAPSLPGFYRYTDPEGDTLDISPALADIGGQETPVAALAIDIPHGLGITIHVPPADTERVVAAIRAASGVQPKCGECGDSGACNGGPCALRTAARPVPDTERRERYAAAIGATDINNAHVIRLATDAAMVVADEERNGRTQRLLDEITRLRAELEQARDLLQRAESYLSALHGSVARHDNLGAGLGCAGCELRDQITAHRTAAPDVQPTRVTAELEQARAAVAELGQAIRLTREYVGEELLPPVEGWSWYDALRRHAPQELTATGSGGQAEDGAQQPNPLAVCVCGHSRGEHVTVSGRLLCDECDPAAEGAFVCKEFEAL